MDQPRPRDEPRALIVAAARGCIGTRFHHQGRLPGVGIDCIGLLVHAVRACGVSFEDDTTYMRVHDAGKLVRALDERLDHIELRDAQPGDIVSFSWGDHVAMQHVGLLTETSPALRMVHANARTRAVVEHDLGAYWSGIICATYRVRGLS